jgi:hypothetical protein
MATLLKLSDAYLCPGFDGEAHITDSSTCCPCGNTNLAGLQRILDRETTTTSLIDILKEEFPGLEEKIYGRVYRS